MSHEMALQPFCVFVCVGGAVLHQVCRQDVESVRYATLVFLEGVAFGAAYSDRDDQCGYKSRCS